MTTPEPERDLAHEGDATSTDATELYETESGVIIDTNDIEVDVVESDEGAVITSQADPEAYGIDVDTATEDPGVGE